MKPYLERELDLAVPSSELSASEGIRRMFLEGETLTAMEAARIFDRSSSLLAIVVGQMKKNGFVFTEERDPGRGGVKHYALANPDHRPSEPVATRTKVRDVLDTVPTDEEIKRERNAKRERDREHRRLEREARRAGIRSQSTTHASSEDRPVLPSIHDLLEVNMVLEVDGEYSIGLRNGSKSYLCTITAVTN